MEKEVCDCLVMSIKATFSRGISPTLSRRARHAQKRSSGAPSLLRSMTSPTLGCPSRRMRSRRWGISSARWDLLYSETMRNEQSTCCFYSLLTGYYIERVGEQAGQAQEPRRDLLVADHGGARPRRPRLHRGTAVIIDY